MTSISTFHQSQGESAAVLPEEAQKSHKSGAIGSPVTGKKQKSNNKRLTKVLVTSLPDRILEVLGGENGIEKLPILDLSDQVDPGQPHIDWLSRENVNAPMMKGWARVPVVGKNYFKRKHHRPFIALRYRFKKEDMQNLAKRLGRGDGSYVVTLVKMHKTVGYYEWGGGSRGLLQDGIHMGERLLVDKSIKRLEKVVAGKSDKIELI